MVETLPKDDERLTMLGLIFESAAGLRRLFQSHLESERSLSPQSFDVLIRLARSPGTELRMSELAEVTSGSLPRRGLCLHLAIRARRGVVRLPNR